MSFLKRSSPRWTQLQSVSDWQLPAKAAAAGSQLIRCTKMGNVMLDRPLFADERNQLLHRIQIIAAERYDSLARAYFQRQWQLAQLQAMHDYQERAADVRFVVSRKTC